LLASTATPGFRPRRALLLIGGAALIAALVYVATTVSVTEPTGGCYFPAAGSSQESILTEGRTKARFNLLYPCQLPGGEALTAINVSGTAGQQTAVLAFDGPFDMTVRQSQVAPILSPDPAGTSHIVVDLFPNIKADVIERNDASRNAEYRVVWAQGGVFFEVLAAGPPLSREQILKVARSLQ